MSFLVPGHLIVDNTSKLANSALPDAPVEPDRPRRRWFKKWRTQQDGPRDAAGPALRQLAQRP